MHSILIFTHSHSISLIVSFVATTTTTEETGGGEHTPNGADLNDQGVEVTNVSFANMSIQALNEMMMGRPANFYESEEVDDDDEDGDEDDYDVQEIQLSPTSAARGSPVWMVPTAAAGAAVTKLRSSNRKTKIFFAVGTSVFLIMFGTGLGGIINTNKAVVSQANLVDDCVTTAPTTKSSKGPTSPTGKSGKSGSQPTRRRMDSLRGVYGNSESGPKKAYLMELRTGSAKYSGGEGEGEEDIMARNLVSTHNTLSTFVLALFLLLIVQCLKRYFFCNVFNFRRVQNLSSRQPEKRLSPLIHQIVKVVKDLSVTQVEPRRR